MKTSIQRLNNIIGQLNGVKRLLAEPKVNCLEVVTQLKAVRAATGSLMAKVLNDEALSCLACEPVKQVKLNKILKEIIK